MLGIQVEYASHVIQFKYTVPGTSQKDRQFKYARKLVKYARKIDQIF